MGYIGNEPADVAVQVGSDVITSTEIQDASIATADIANDAITANKVDDDGTGFQMGSLGLGTAVSGSHKLTVGGTSLLEGELRVNGGQASIYGAEGGDAILELNSDEADDNADRWQVYVDSSDSNKFKIRKYSTGSWVDIFNTDTNGNSTFAGTINSTIANTQTHSENTEPNSTTEFLTLHNNSGSDGAHTDKYVTMKMAVGSGGTSEGHLIYRSSADNQGEFIFNSRHAGSTYNDILTLKSDKSATFAGTITANTGSKITSSSADTTFSIETTSGTSIFPVLDFVSSHSSVGGKIRQDGSDVITIDNDQDVTFADDITVSGNATFEGGTTTLPVGGILRFGERGNLTHHNTSYDMTFNTNSTANAMVIKGTGNVAIGGTGGYQKLSVESGNIYMTAGYAITWANGNATINESSYALNFNTYNGSAVDAALTLSGNNIATFTGDIVRGNTDYTNRVYSGFTSGDGSLSVTFPIQDNSSLLITAMFSHYGAGINSYGTTKMCWLSCRDNSQSIHNIDEITSSNGGSWSIATSSSTVTVSKVAGTYSGGGHYWVKIEGSANL